MATNTLIYSEFGNIPVAQLPLQLNSFLANAVCKVFSTQEDPNSPPKDQLILQELINPLQWILYGGDPNVIFATFANQDTPSNFCGKVFKSGEPAYFCK